MKLITERWNNLTPAEFCGWFGCGAEDLGTRALATLKTGDFRWRPAKKAELQEHLKEYLPKLKGTWIERDREKNRQVWSNGWRESLAEIKAKGVNPETCRPKYFRGSPFLRLQGDLVVTPNPFLENDLLNAAREYLFWRYLSEVPVICELGCGSGQNLLLLAEMFPEKQIIGLDWVEPCVEIAMEIGKKHPNVSGALFDMTEPDSKLKLPPGVGIVSIHALEQIGERHAALLDWIFNQKPSVVVQHEPVVEFYDPANLLDFLATWFSEKRSYLKGYLPALQALVEKKKIEILQAFRPKVGGVYHEASVLVWRPIKARG